MLRPLRNRPSDTPHNGLRWSHIRISRRRELVDTPIDAETCDWPAGCGDVRDAEVVDHWGEGAGEGDGLGELSAGCADEGYGYAVAGVELGAGRGEGGGQRAARSKEKGGQEGASGGVHCGVSGLRVF
jgi:hypothetical protein